jgi:hypothetical protein
MDGEQMKYESVADLYDKVDWEGGLTEALFGYGIAAEDLPDGTPGDIVAAWATLEDLSGTIRGIEAWLEDNADEGREYD